MLFSIFCGGGLDETKVKYIVTVLQSPPALVRKSITRMWPQYGAD